MCQDALGGQLGKHTSHCQEQCSPLRTCLWVINQNWSAPSQLIPV